METIELRNGGMTATVARLGAELRALACAGDAVIWTPDAAVWDGTCPVLFPVIGRVGGDAIRVDGRAYPMPMHGFALASRFSVVERTGRGCSLELRAGPETRRHYPYDFALKMTFRLGGAALVITAEIHNEGRVVLPASLGLHPGFRWPLRPGLAKTRHVVTFGDDAGPILFTRPIDRLIGPDRSVLPLEGGALRLDDALFETGGLALLALKSRSVRFGSDDGRAGIRLDFPDMTGVMLWSRPGGDFLCIEPLRGHADPIGFAGDLMEKPGMTPVAPGETLRLTVTITPEFAPPEFAPPEFATS